MKKMQELEQEKNRNNLTQNNGNFKKEIRDSNVGMG